VEIGPELQGTLITLANAAVSYMVWKLKTYRDRAGRAEKRAEAITAAVDDALANDGKISNAELRRIISVADRLA